MQHESNEINGINGVNGISEAKDLLQAGELIAFRYRVERCVRDHPLGALYRCHDETGDRPVLLQRLRKEFSSTAVRDRLFETRGTAALEVTAIADILDYGEDLDGRPFLVTVWSDDPSLADVERPLSFREAVAIVERVAVALEPVHRNHIIHGGIEPNSVLVDDERELTGLLDFGLVPALEAGANKTRALPLLVSPAYAAPELIRGEPMTPAADVYALGILLWELIFGSAPFRGPTLRVLDSHLNRPLPDVELPFDAPASFEWILRRMLAKQVGDRFVDAGEVAAQLRPYVLTDDALLLADDDDPLDPLDEATTAFERALDEDSRMLVPAIVDVAGPADDLAFEYLPARRGARRMAALAGLGCAVLLSWWGLANRQLDEPAGQDAPEIITAQRVVDAPDELLGGEAAATLPGAAASAQDLSQLDPMREKLSAANLRSRKAELYRRVEQRCVDGRMRRTIKLSVRVAPTGEVEGVNVIGGMASTKLGRCARQQAKALEYPATEAGGAYTYTLRLR